MSKNNNYFSPEIKDPLDKTAYPDYHLTAPQTVVSTTECTGMVVTPPGTSAEVQSYRQICEIPLTKEGESGDERKNSQHRHGSN
ncbi:MAG: hypothetical protein RR387_07380 [Clostridiales bacterium]